MYGEDELLPLSGLQHVLFCERQWALIHIEKLWVENLLTAQGRLLHDKVHEKGTGRQGEVIAARGLALRSLRLGLAGQADMVEFHRAAEKTGGAVTLAGRKGLWRPFPVEYKRGRPKPGPYDEVQLCAQAMCLEEMLQVDIPAGALYYGQPRRRTEIEFSGDLRKKTETAARRLHLLFQQGKTPPAHYEKKCRACSMYDLCLPKTATGQKSVAKYLRQVVEEEQKGDPL